MDEHQRPAQWFRNGWIWLTLFVVVWGFTDVRRRGRIDPHNVEAHKTDFTVYTIAGEAFFDGRDPYAVSNSRGWHYLYPPLFALLVAPLGQLETQWQCVIWYFLSVAMLYGAFYECRRVLAWAETTYSMRPLPTWVAWGAVLACLLPVMNSLQRGQVGVPIVYTLLLGFRLVLENRGGYGALLGGMVLAMPITLKLTPALAVGLLGLHALALLWRRYTDREQFRQTAGLCAGVVLGLGLFIFLVPGTILGQRANLAHLHTWMDRVVTNDQVGADNDFLHHSKRNQSLANAVYRLGNFFGHLAGGPDDLRIDDLSLARVPTMMDKPVVKRALTGCYLIGIAMIFGGIWVGCRRKASPAAQLADHSALLPLFGLACLSTLLISPISWGHHFTVMLPAVLFVPWWHWQRGNEKLAWRLTISAIALMATHYFVLDLSGRLGVLGLGMSAWFVVAAVATIRTLRRPPVAEGLVYEGNGPHLKLAA